MTDKLTEARFTREPMENEQEFEEQRSGDDRRDLTPHQEYLERRLSTFFAKCLAIFAVLGITNAIALLGFGIVLGKQSDLTHQIQSQRYDALVTSCVETNQRNTDVNDRIDDAIKALPPKGQARATAKAKPFRLILNAAVPYRNDCPSWARARLKGEQQ